MPDAALASVVEAVEVPTNRLCSSGYFEATGVTFDIGPASWVTFEIGAPLVLVGRQEDVEWADDWAQDQPDSEWRVPRGRPIFALASAPTFAASDNGFGSRAYFAGDTDLGDGVTARAGASMVIRGITDADRFEIGTVGKLVREGQWYAGARMREELVRVTSCAALASSRPEPPADWNPTKLATILEQATVVTDAGTHLIDVSADDVVDLIKVRRKRALVRVEREGYLLTGWIPARSVKQGPLDDDGGGFGTCRCGFGPGGSGVSGWWTRCNGRSELRTGAPLLTGADHHDGVRRLPAFTHGPAVSLLGADGDRRMIEVVQPTPEIRSLVAWAHKEDLSLDCQ